MADREAAVRGDGVSAEQAAIRLARAERRVDWRRILGLGLGIGIFAALYALPAWPDAVDPAGNRFVLTHEGKAALGLLGLALAWWATEVVPIGVTAVAIGVLQALFFIRPAREAFADFMDPAVWLVLASLVIGMTFTKTGFTKRVAYKMLALAGERTRMLYFGCFAVTALLTLVMTHTTAAATLFPLLMAVHSLYEDGERPTRFGKGLFIGMAFAAASCSVVSLLGSGRAPVAAGLYRDLTGRDISFFEWTYYMLPLGWGMALLLWLYCLIRFPPERPAIAGLGARARALYERLGPVTRNEYLAALAVGAAFVLLAARHLVPALAGLDKSAAFLAAVVLFFVFRILSIQDLEEIPWNIALLFGGALSMGTCLWQTGAARWLAVASLVWLQGTGGVAFLLLLGLALMILTNFVVNVALIAACLPAALVVAHYLGVAPEMVLYTTMAAASMPFMLLLGAAPNAIAYSSRQFTAREFFWAGMPASLLLMAVLGLFVWLIWPLMGMPLLNP
jgi:sodium-dependent dicarboxylate transporter 2/3/5